MANSQTLRTMEGSLRENHILHIEPTVATSMTASSGLGVFDELSTECDLFVGQHINKYTPRSIQYMFGKMMVSDHSFNIKILTSDYTISSSKASAKFVQEITPLVSNLNIFFSQPEDSFPSVSRTFNLSVSCKVNVT